MPKLSFLDRNGYCPRENYVSAHLHWIADHKTFVPKEQQYIGKEGYSYYDIMTELYTSQLGKCPTINEYAFITFILDKLWLVESGEITKKMSKAVERLRPTPNGKWFITIGFNHQTWSVEKCKKCISRILDMEWIISAKANFELYRTNGLHPHVHFAIETKEPKSRILDKLFRPQYVQKLVLSKNFIDVQPFLDPQHLKYINLDKVSEKMECVEKDRVWRLENDIPDYEKQWQHFLSNCVSR